MLYNLDHTVLENRTIKLAIRAVSYNAPLSFRIKGVMTIEKLKSLMKLVDQISDARVYKAVMLLGFFGLFRLATLVPSSQSGFSAARFPTHGDVIWGSPGAHFITKCAKNMQTLGQVQVIQLPYLSDKSICPVSAHSSQNTSYSPLPDFTYGPPPVRIRISQPPLFGSLLGFRQ